MKRRKISFQVKCHDKQADWVDGGWSTSHRHDVPPRASTTKQTIVAMPSVQTHTHTHAKEMHFIWTKIVRLVRKPEKCLPMFPAIVVGSRAHFTATPWLCVCANDRLEKLAHPCQCQCWRPTSPRVVPLGRRFSNKSSGKRFVNVAGPSFRPHPQESVGSPSKRRLADG